MNASDKKKAATHAMERLAALALREDIGRGDITSSACIPAGLSMEAEIIAKQDCVVYGLGMARCVFGRLGVLFKPLAREGDKVNAGKSVAKVSGAARRVLAGERAALNFLGRLSGTATMTRQFVEAVRGTGAKIYDTRKTTPGLRFLEKAAVKAGGGSNHRMGLYDAVLIKDNHLLAFRVCAGQRRRTNPGEAAAALARKTRRNCPGKRIEVEVSALPELAGALAARPDIILLDNMTVAAMKKAVKLRDLFCARNAGRGSGRVILEASGNVVIRSVRRVAETGVDMISIGALTHSAPSVDFSMQVRKTGFGKV